MLMASVESILAGHLGSTLSGGLATQQPFCVPFCNLSPSEKAPAYVRSVNPLYFGWFRARRLTDEQRSAIATYFAVYKGQENGVVKLALTQTLHPAVQRAYALLEDAWREVGSCNTDGKC